MITLVYTDTNKPVKFGDVVHIGGAPCVVSGWRTPDKPSSTGRVYVQSMDERKTSAEYFPTVIGADWIGRTDR